MSANGQGGSRHELDDAWKDAARAALKKRGMSMRALARHFKRDVKTVHLLLKKRSAGGRVQYTSYDFAAEVAAFLDVPLPFQLDARFGNLRALQYEAPEKAAEILRAVDVLLTLARTTKPTK